MYSAFAAQLDPPNRFSTDLAEVIRLGNERPLSLAEAHQLLQGRVFAFCVLALAIPSLLPLAIPGVGSATGALILLMGCRMAFNFQPPLPGGILKRTIDRTTINGPLRRVMKVVSRLERLIKPRFTFVFRWKWTGMVMGLAVAAGGAELMVTHFPFYLPFAEVFPALSIALLAAGMMEKDGLAALGGMALTVMSWTYFIPMYNSLKELMQNAPHH